MFLHIKILIIMRVIGNGTLLDPSKMIKDLIRANNNYKKNWVSKLKDESK